ncbi:SLP adapter and CSK-interacting membrane protein [Equus quagga]|uniref:SLP adapter and CSK-interacting membrane protein n=1 Tax=Equus quagga TaxID=89248 RepID=UPI001EE2F6E8|nr:SLP adapter and CSK-interacting membrane protein [Equus quagga]
MAKVSTEMDWWKRNFWIILAVTIIIVSTGLSIILYCVCRLLLRQGKKFEIARPVKQDEEKMYENVTNQSSVQLPPLPPRGLLSSERASPQETPSPPPATYTLVNKLRNKKVNSIPSYVEPEEDYDDVAIPENMEKHHLETSMSPFWPAEEGSHNLF